MFYRYRLTHHKLIILMSLTVAVTRILSHLSFANKSFLIKYKKNFSDMKMNPQKRNKKKRNLRRLRSTHETSPTFKI
jgi:hypothetical protein